MTNSCFNIGQASSGDAGAMAALHARSLPSCWPEAEFARSLSTPATLGLVARTPEEAMAGFILLRGAGGEVEILTLAVDEAFRRLGLATALAERAMGEAKRQGAAEIFLEVGMDNHSAQALYRALGFEETAVRRDYYAAKQGPAIDALVMRRALT